MTAAVKASSLVNVEISCSEKPLCRKACAPTMVSTRLCSYTHLVGMGVEVSAPELPGASPYTGPTSLELISELAAEATDGSVARRLSPDVLLAFELGQLISEALSRDVDEAKTLRIAELIRKLTSNEWLTGKPDPTSGTESIHFIVQSRLTLLDELLSTQPWPSKESKSVASTTQLGRAVVAELRPRLDQIQDNIADFAYCASRDAAVERSRPTPKLLSPNAAAKKFGVSAYALRREHAAGRIEGCRVGTHLKLVEDSVADWCRGNGKEPEANRTSTRSAPGSLPRKPPSFI